MDLTTEQYQLIATRRSQADLSFLLEALENEGSISAPSDSPAIIRAHAMHDTEREQDKRQGGKGETHWEKRKAQLEAEAKEQEKIAKENERERKEREDTDERESRRLADKEAERKTAARS